MHSETEGLETRHYIRYNEEEVLGYGRWLQAPLLRQGPPGLGDRRGRGPDVLNRYTYEPYGEIHWQKNAAFDNPWQFAQGYFDSETGLYKLGVRYYDENRAAFTQFDPLAGKISDPVTLTGINTRTATRRTMSIRAAEALKAIASWL